MNYLIACIYSSPSSLSDDFSEIDDDCFLQKSKYEYTNTRNTYICIWQHYLEYLKTELFLSISNVAFVEQAMDEQEISSVLTFDWIID